MGFDKDAVFVNFLFVVCMELIFCGYDFIVLLCEPTEPVLQFFYGESLFQNLSFLLFYHFLQPG